MKNNLFICFTAVLLICVNSTCYTQSPAGITRLSLRTSHENLIPASKQFNSFKGSGLTFRNDINTKAVRNFIMNYGDVTDVTWLQSGDGPAAYFTRNGIKTNVFYHKKGDFERMFQYYYDDKLPQDIRHLVKSRDYDFSICCIIELNTNGKTIYDVKIEDKLSYKTTRIIDGEMEVREEFFKA